MSVAATNVLPDAGAHAQGTSANTATPSTVLTPKDSKGAQKARVCWLTARTNGAYVTFDGSVPTAANGIEVPVGALLGPFPVPAEGNDIKFCSANAAAASILNALFAS